MLIIGGMDKLVCPFDTLINCRDFPEVVKK